MDKLRILTELGLGHGAIKTTKFFAIELYVVSKLLLLDPPKFLDLSLGIEL